MKKAVFIKNLEDWVSDARLYKLSPPMQNPCWEEGEEGEYEYVVVSAVVAAFSGAETYIFGCNKDGENVNFTELPGSFRGGLDHKWALKRAGYIVTDVPVKEE